MAHRRILSLWFPRLAAERHLRRLDATLPAPLAVVGDRNGAQVLTSLDRAASAAGLRAGQPLRDATAMCPGLVTRPADPLAEGAFLGVLRRWAGKFSPWVAEEPPDSLVIDLTGCAHLFGGEAGLLDEVAQDCARLGLTVRAGVGDTRGAAWALARHAGTEAVPVRSGDAIDQEARATRSRAVRRRGWERGGTAPVAGAGAPVLQGTIAPPGQMRQALADLPLTALRLPDDAVEGLARLGLRRIGDIMGMPSGALARRFGTHVLRRLDQALGTEPEPVSPTRAAPVFAVRLTLPEPVGLRGDVEAGMDRLLPALCDRLRAAGRGARQVRFEGVRTDGTAARITVGLARATADPGAIRPLLMLKLDAMEAGFGFDILRIEAPLTEPAQARQMTGHAEAAAAARRRGPGLSSAATQIEDLIGRLGARLGTEAVMRFHPADSHIPEKTAMPLMAAWSAPLPDAWPAPSTPRPLILFRPEPVDACSTPARSDPARPDTSPPDPTPPDHALPATFRWRRRTLDVARATGPERIAPEWWLDDPAWRTGVRDYWRVETAGGDRLWLYYAHGGGLPAGWFCQGTFA